MSIVRGESLAKYHAQSALSNSKLNVFKQNPALYHGQYITKKIPKRDTPALLFGRAFDSWFFDGPKGYAKRYVARPSHYVNDAGKDCKWRTGVEYCDDWIAAQVIAGREVVTAEDEIRFWRMEQAARAHPLVAALLSQGEPQVTFRMHSSLFDLDLQVKPDWFSEKPIELPELGLSSGGLPYMVDLKTIGDMSDLIDLYDQQSPRTGKPIAEHGYHRQGGLAQYVAAQDVGKTAHFLVFVEKDEPFACNVIMLAEDFLAIGWQDVQADLRNIRACMTADVWPSSLSRVITAIPPQWLLDKSLRQADTLAKLGMPSTELAEASA